MLVVQMLRESDLMVLALKEASDRAKTPFRPQCTSCLLTDKSEDVPGQQGRLREQRVVIE